MHDQVERATSRVVVRKADADHLDAVGALTLAAYDGLPRRLSDDYRVELADARIRAATDATVLVALRDGVVAGSVTLSTHDTEMFEYRFGIDGDCGFRMLAVAPDQEGHGVGSALVHDCIRRCQRAGARRMVITTMDTMTRAQRLYAARGFVRRRDLDVQFPSGIGMAYHLDLVADASEHFPPPGPVPEAPVWHQDRPTAHPCH